MADMLLTDTRADLELLDERRSATASYTSATARCRKRRLRVPGGPNVRTERAARHLMTSSAAARKASRRVSRVVWSKSVRPCPA